MRTLKFFAIAAVAMVTVASCGKKKEQENGKMTMLGKELPEELQQYAPKMDDPELEAYIPTSGSADTTSYLLGVNTGLMFKGNGFFENIEEINMDEFKKGIADALQNGTPSNPYAMDSVWAQKFKVSPYDMNMILGKYLEARKAFIAQFNKKLGENYLAANKENEGVKVTESGLQYILHNEGEGDKVRPEDRVVVNYKGTLLDGTVFDENDGIEFAADQVIPGWTEGLGLLGKGGKATLYIPGDLAYGERGTRGIEPNSVLIFEVEVIDIIRPEVEAEEALEVVPAE